MIPFIDLQRQHAALRAELLAAAARVIDSSQFVLGAEGKALEQELAALCGVSWALGVASGTDALRLALTALGVGPGDEVITPAFSFVASATTIMMAGATPVFVDIDPATYTLDLSATERAITERTRAIMPVHLYGQPAPMDRVLELARAHRLAVIEDAAQAVGGAWGEVPSRVPSLHGATPAARRARDALDRRGDLDGRLLPALGSRSTHVRRRRRAALARGLSRVARGPVVAVLRRALRRRGRARGGRRAPRVRAPVTSAAETLKQRLATSPTVGLIGLGYVGLPL